ncbi:hypothetical protein SBD_3505 [Streptomyces bottropensis ATCC 25435]|uniref:Uncharacterized protein n=1 Tax=Streptomyces bottropensis ATCC 25435 TaxID=1054862 RepID=M3F3S1_9ACTN|nr:hypothetical protein SBD_3505 [Streptomyces bottropensis ATCC 25435]
MRRMPNFGDILKHMSTPARRPDTGGRRGREGRRHNECTTCEARGAKRGARFVPACDYQDRFTEPPH